MIKTLLTLALAFLLPIMAVGGYVYWSVRDLPVIDKVVEEGVNPTKWTQVLSRQGKPILSYGKFRHKDVTLDNVSPYFVDALLAVEDRRFYSHVGIDPIGIVRALYRDLTHQKMMEGASTLTQQLARNVFLSNERSLRRKIREAALAIQLERELSKDEILALYINNIYFGEGAYGIHAASEIYFNKKPAQLSVHEAALLAGLPQAPSRYDPFHNMEGAKNRRNEVLAAMVDDKRLPKEDLERYQNMPVKLNPNGRELSRADRAPFFNRYLMNRILQQYELDEQGFWQSGYKVYTTLDLNAQLLAERALKQQSTTYGRTKPQEQGALLSLNPKTGEILAYVGGLDYSKSQFDRVNQALPSPGSLFKIFTYTTAIDNGYAPGRVYLDEPIQMKEWRPENYDKQHHGYMTLAQALIHSNNIVAVKVLHELGPESVVAMAHRMGINSKLEPYLSLTLGGSSVTLMEMTSAFGVLANQGVRVEPYGIQKILDRDGKVLYEHAPIKTNVLNRRTVDTMVNMMMAVVQRGTGRGANIGRPVAGKTGTSDDHRDGWFVGFTPDVITGVWVGNDDNSPVPHLAGGGLPATIWRSYMRPYLADKMTANFDLQYSQAIHDTVYTHYNLDELSDSETNSELALEDRVLPTMGEGDMEADPADQSLPYGNPGEIQTQNPQPLQKPEQSPYMVGPRQQQPQPEPSYYRNGRPVYGNPGSNPHDYNRQSQPRYNNQPVYQAPRTNNYQGPAYTVYPPPPNSGPGRVYNYAPVNQPPPIQRQPDSTTPVPPPSPL